MAPSSDTISAVLNSLRPKVLHRVWLISDLQQSDLEIARECLTKATADFISLDLECDQIWYLGDSVQGRDLKNIENMVDLQIELLTAFKTPLIFTCGNHEFDPHFEKANQDSSDETDLKVISWEKFSRVPNWKTSKTISDHVFTHRLGDFTIFFFPDHAHPQGKWITSGGNIHGNKELYPYGAESYQQISSQIKNTKGPVFLAGHSSFAGGLRPSELMSQALPLPDNVVAHFHGHCHLGDTTWGGPTCFRKYSTVDHQNIPQFDIAALENHRGDAVRSAILEIYDDKSFGVYFRQHDQEKWDDLFVISY